MLLSEAVVVLSETAAEARSGLDKGTGTLWRLWMLRGGLLNRKPGRNEAEEWQPESRE